MSSIEYFDVVDMNDMPTGELTTKPEAHSKMIIHRCVAVFVFDKQGRLYVQEHNSGLLDHTVGGHVSAGEDYETAAKRESEEEVGLIDQKIVPVKLGIDSPELFNPDKQVQRIHHMFGLFECFPDESWRFTPNDEVSSIYPESVERIVQEMQQESGKFTPGFINMMGAYIELKALPISFDLNYCKNNWRV